MILYIENPEDSTKKLPELINEFSNVARHKINIQKLDALHIITNHHEEKLRRIGLTKKVKVLKKL